MTLILTILPARSSLYKRDSQLIRPNWPWNQGCLDYEPCCPPTTERLLESIFSVLSSRQISGPMKVSDYPNLQRDFDFSQEVL